MAIALITGSSGLIGSEAARFFHHAGLDVVGIDNDMRKYFFGPDSSTEWSAAKLRESLKNFKHHTLDIRDNEGIQRLFRECGRDIAVVVHTAAQPSHDWAAKEPLTDFGINATGTLNLLEATRHHAPNAVFIFTSTNKVYGDLPNSLPLVETATRWELVASHPWHTHGIDESMSIDRSQHSIFGASKVAADVMVQEYGRYFGMKTGVFRGGCLTGPSHSPSQLHGFLAYLVKCALQGTPYTVFGYKGKQVRDNIHSYDLINAFWHFFQNPRQGEVFNMGGSRHSNCSVLEAITQIEAVIGRKIQFSLSDQNRAGDHIFWISDVRRFQSFYPEWKYKYDLTGIIHELVNGISERVKPS